MKLLLRSLPIFLNLNNDDGMRDQKRMKRLLVLGVLLVASLGQASDEVEIITVGRTTVKASYSEQSNNVTIQLLQQEKLLDEKIISLQRRSAARLHRLVYLLGDRLFLGDISGYLRLFSVGIRKVGDMPMGFGSVVSKEYRILADRGDLASVENHLVLVLGYPGSVNLIDKASFELVAAKAVLDWPRRIVRCGNSFYIGPLALSVRPSLLGKISFKDSADIKRKLTDGSPLFEKVALPESTFFADMDSTKPETLTVTAVKPNGESVRYEFPCER